MERSPVTESSGVFIHSIIWINFKDMIGKRHWHEGQYCMIPLQELLSTGDCRASKMAQ